MLNKFGPFPWGLACGGLPVFAVAPPVMTGMTPGTGQPGTAVTITGTGFGPSTGSLMVHGQVAIVNSWTPTQVVFLAPTQSTYPDTGTVLLTTAAGRTESSHTFTTTVPNPAITNVSVSTAAAGASVTITGTNFGATQGTGSVTFHGVAGTVTSWSNTSITVTVPAQGSYPDVANLFVNTNGGLQSGGWVFTTTTPYLGRGVFFAASNQHRCRLQSSAYNATAAGQTLACWVKLAGGSGTTFEAFNHYDAANFGFLFQITTALQARFRTISPGVVVRDTPLVAISANVWHLLVGGYDASGCYLSVDGAAFVSGSANSLYTGLTTLAVGSTLLTGNNPDGAVDEAAYWQRLLTITEVGYLWKGGVGLSAYDVLNNPTYASLLANLVDWYDCDDLDGANLVSATGSGRTLVGDSGTSTYTSVTGVR